MRLAGLVLVALVALGLVACSGNGPHVGDPCTSRPLVVDSATGHITLPEIACPDGKSLACCSEKWTETDLCVTCDELSDEQLYCTIATDRFTICGKTFTATTSTTAGT